MKSQFCKLGSSVGLSASLLCVLPAWAVQPTTAPAETPAGPVAPVAPAAPSAPAAPAAPVAPAAPAAPAAPQLNRHTSPDHRISVGVPQGWRIDATNPEQLFLFCPEDGPDDDFAENMNFLRIDLPPEEGEVNVQLLRDGAAVGQEQLAQQYPDFQASPLQDITLGGYPGVVTTYTMSVNGVEMTGRQWYLVLAPQTALVATFTGKTGDFDELGALVEQVMATVKPIEDVPAEPQGVNAPEDPNGGAAFTHSSDAFGMTIDIPAGWRLDQDNAMQLMVFGPQDGPDDTFGENLGLRKIAKPEAEGPITMDELRGIVGASMEQLKGQFPGLEHDESRQVEIAGHQALMTTSTLEMNGLPLTVRQWFIIAAPQKAVIATYTSATDKFEGTIDTAVGLLNSLRVDQ